MARVLSGGAVTTRTITVLILVAVVALLIGWDIYAAVHVAHGQATISDVVLQAAKAHPVLPFCLGVVAGHLLWSQKESAP